MIETEDETTAPLPEAPYLTGVQDGWHAVSRENLEWTREYAPGIYTTSVCGKPVRLALKYGAYDPASDVVASNRCPDCAWIVAGEKGDLDAEVQRLMPADEDRAALDLLIPDALIAVTAAAMIVEAITIGHDDYDIDDEMAKVQLLAAITRHAPVVLLTEECADGGCEHDGSPGCPEAAVGCAACSLRHGSWAGEWQGTFRNECTIPAPCAVLIQLAEAAKEMLAEAKRAEQAEAEFAAREGR